MRLAMLLILGTVVVIGLPMYAQVPGEKIDDKISSESRQASASKSHSLSVNHSYCQNNNDACIEPVFFDHVFAFQPVLAGIYSQVACGFINKPSAKGFNSVYQLFSDKTDSAPLSVVLTSQAKNQVYPLRLAKCLN